MQNQNTLVFLLVISYMISALQQVVQVIISSKIRIDKTTVLLLGTTNKNLAHLTPTP